MPKPIKKQTWSNIDVFGLLNGLTVWDDQYKSLKYVRKPYENNLEIKSRIHSSHDYTPDVDKQGLLNGISNEFDLVPYNTIKKTTFELTNIPMPSGAIGVQDISGYYMDSSGDWVSLFPQVWSDTYAVAKADGHGFIVWQNTRVANISGYKNYSYSNHVEVFKILPDYTEVKFEYYIESIDADNNIELIRYTDMNTQTDEDDTRFTYRYPETNPSLTDNIVAYTLEDIPSGISDAYYYDTNTGMARSFLYSLKDFITSNYRHTWNKAKNGSVIWDVHKNYGSGEIPSFYDAEAPYNCGRSGILYNGFRGGVDSLSYAAYPEKMVEQSGESQSWYLKVYPGQLYIDGIRYYYFEKPQVSQINFSAVSGLFEADIPSGLQRGMYTIMAKSGYYDGYFNQPKDVYLSGMYEDYSYFTGADGDNSWANVYRKRPYVTTIKGGIDLELEFGQYNIDYRTGKIYTKLPTGFEEATMIWDNLLTPSGFSLPYDFNPLNEQNLSFEKFFVYLSIPE